MVNVTINGKQYKVQDGSTILDAARSVGIHIPTLCYLKDINSIGACRVCVVEVEGCAKLVAACNNQVWEGMVVHTNSPKVRESRRNTVELIISQHDSQIVRNRPQRQLHPADDCERSGHCRASLPQESAEVRMAEAFPAGPRRQKMHQMHALRTDL